MFPTNAQLSASVLKLDCKMDAFTSNNNNNKRNSDSSSDDDFSDDNDSNYVSYQDMDSDEKSSASPAHSTGGKSRSGYIAAAAADNTKRFQTSRRNGRDDDDDDDYVGEVFRNNSSAGMTKRSTNKKQQQMVERQPTRRPNPKIFNRNALMARENRKKKKEHLETLTRDVDSLKSENAMLRHKLRKRSGMVHKLRDEGLYLKSIIANKTSIMTLLKTIQGNTIPITSSGLSFVTDQAVAAATNGTAAATTAPTPPSSYKSTDENKCKTTTICSSPSSSSSSLSGRSCFDDEYDDEEHHQKENGTVLVQDDVDPFLSMSLMAIPNYPYFLDLEEFSFDHQTTNDDDVLRLDNWEHLLNDDTPFTKQQQQQQRSDDNNCCSSVLSNVSHEHNYFNNNFIEQSSMQTDAAADQPGICLHLSSGRISLEFCSSCHRNSQNAWIEEM